MDSTRRATTKSLAATATTLAGRETAGATLASADRRAALSRIGNAALLLAGLGAGAPAQSRAAAANPPLPRPESWQGLLRRSSASGRPIVVLFSAPGCAWCHLVRQDHLRHLAREQEARRVFVVEMEMTDRKPFADAGQRAPAGGTGARGANGSGGPGGPAAFGRAESPAALAAALGVRIAPTVVFAGPDGELAERLVGYASADFYGAYLDDRISAASAALRRAAES